MKKKYIIIIPLLLTALCGCATNTNNNTNDIAETKTYLYNYDYETDSNGEVSTAYNEEKPSVDANEPQITEEPIVKLNKNSICEINRRRKKATECTQNQYLGHLSKQSKHSGSIRLPNRNRRKTYRKRFDIFRKK